MKWFLQSMYDSDFLNIAVCGVRDAEGRREEFNNAVENSTGKDYINSIVDILGRYFEHENDYSFKNFEVISENDKREADPDKGLYKMSEMIPMAPDGVKYWNSLVEKIDSDVAKNRLFIFKTPSGYKTIGMISTNDIEKMKAEQAASHAARVDTRKHPTQVKKEEIIIDGDYREVKPEEEEKKKKTAATVLKPEDQPSIVSTEKGETKPADPAETLNPQDDKPEKFIEFNGFFEMQDVWPGDTVVANAPKSEDIKNAIAESQDSNVFLGALDKLIVDKTTNKLYLDPTRAANIFLYIKRYPELADIVEVAMKLNKYTEFGQFSYPTAQSPDAHNILTVIFYNNDGKSLRECYIDPNDILGNGYNLVTKRSNHTNIYTETYIPFTRKDIIAKLILGKLEKSDYIDIAKCYPRALGDILQKVRIKNQTLNPDAWRRLMINISKIITSMPIELFFNLADVKTENDFKLTVRQPDWQIFVDPRFLAKSQEEAAAQLNSRLGYMNDQLYVWFHPNVDNDDKEHEYHVYTNSGTIYFDPWVNYKKKFDKNTIEDAKKNKTSQKKVEKSNNAPQQIVKEASESEENNKKDKK